MAVRRKSIQVSFGRLPGRVGAGTQASLRKFTISEARNSMAAVIDQYSRMIKSLKTVTPDALENAMMPAFEKSQEYVPFKTGALKASGKLSVTRSDPPEAEITYGTNENPNVWYAALVHEFVWLNHEPPTRAKYLQAAMEEELDAMMTSLAIDYAAAMGMG